MDFKVEGPENTEKECPFDSFYFETLYFFPFFFFCYEKKVGGGEGGAWPPSPSPWCCRPELGSRLEIRYSL